MRPLFGSAHEQILIAVFPVKGDHLGHFFTLYQRQGLGDLCGDIHNSRGGSSLNGSGKTLEETRRQPVRR